MLNPSLGQERIIAVNAQPADTRQALAGRILLDKMAMIVANDNRLGSLRKRVGLFKGFLCKGFLCETPQIGRTVMEAKILVLIRQNQLEAHWQTLEIIRMLLRQVVFVIQAGMLVESRDGLENHQTVPVIRGRAGDKVFFMVSLEAGDFVVNEILDRPCVVFFARFGKEKSNVSETNERTVWIQLLELTDVGYVRMAVCDYDQWKFRHVYRNDFYFIAGLVSLD